MSIRKVIEKTQQGQQQLVKHLVQHVRATDSERTILVAGCQRSGTNMLMDILDLSLATDVFHERDNRAFDQYQMRDMLVIKQLQKQSRAPVFVLKTLCELELLPELAQELAPAKILWIYRDFHDVVNSMLKSFSNQSQQVHRLITGHDDSWWGRGLSPGSLALLRSLVTPDLTDTDAAALQWYVRNIMFFESALEGEQNVKLIKYEQLVAEPQSILKQTLDFVDLPLGNKMTNYIFSGSISKHAAPSFSPEIEQLCLSLLSRLDSSSARINYQG
ncbi:sulfotransferase [Motilimonas sp. 1_MG-2023]|uniref:sulfotransferase domain-containing protein n=1 Tax=Motilimonas sp. 1_MG-2023 TaxID=3062672 RepID=UPI0026E2916C|nr:sulfotransferase domain-containing protein [Motilimonas sp. 1_MG-2023]MDO6524825.1 sulfotransferase [Motilimonas sp. 1_MG-2023]